MTMTDRLRRRLRHLARSERGFALPTALLATVISFSLASAAVVASVTSQRGTARDHNSKEAIAAADAGANVALLRLNRYALSSSTPCLGISGSTLGGTGAAGDGWCPEITGSIGGATYSYRVSPVASNVCGAVPNVSCVVSTGASESVSRRIDVTFTSSTAGGVLEKAGVIGEKGITLGGNADIHVGIGTNGTVKGEGANNVVCGDIRHGVGVEWNSQTNNGVHQCSGYSVTEGNASLPQVSSFMPAEIATNNSNYRLVKCTNGHVPEGCQSDTYNGQWTATTPFNPTTRTISLSGNGGSEPILTLSGGDYWICRLTLSGGHLIMADGAHVRIFFDTPEHCGISAGESQVSFSGNSTIEATGYQPKVGQFDLPGLYLLGSPTIKTYASLAGNSGTNEFMIYGPNTDITISGNANYKGVIVGRTITDSGNGTISQDSGFKPEEIGGATVYSRQSYVECAGATSSPPSANC